MTPDTESLQHTEHRETEPANDDAAPDAAEPAPAQEVEVVPPALSIADVDALIKTLDHSDIGSEPQRQTMTMAINALARLNLGLVTEETFLKQIAKRTATAIGTLKKVLSQLKREMGIKITVAPEAEVICRRYVFVKQLNAFWDRNARTVCELKGVSNMHIADMPVDDESGKPMDPLDIMLAGMIGGMTCDKVDAIGFVPGEEELFQDGGCSILNVWTKPDIVPIEGDVSIFLDHVEYILDGEATIIKHVLDFLAHLVQKPAEKIKSTILIIGEPGVGKSIIGEMMIRLLGEKNVTAIEDSDLRSSFNEWMDGIQLVLIHELNNIKDRSTKSRLKQYLTDPWIRINRKRVPTYSYRNRVNFLTFSNYEDAANIDKGDRRWMIWKSKAVKKDDQYYKDLWHWFERGGAECLLYHLQTRDLSDFNPNAAPPGSKGKDEAIADSRGDIESYLQDLFDAGANPFRHDLVSVTDVIEWFGENRKTKVSHKQLTSFFRSIGAENLGQFRIKDTRPRVWAIRNAPEWKESVGDGSILKDAWRDIPEAALTADERARFLGRT